MKSTSIIPIIIAALIYVGYMAYDFYYPSVTAKMKSDVRILRSDFTDYSATLRLALQKYDKLKRESPSVSNRFDTKVGTIRENLLQKLSLQKSLTQSVLVDKERGKEALFLSQIKKYYAIDDAKRLETIIDEAVIIHEITTKPQKSKAFMKRLYDRSYGMYEKLQMHYSDQNDTFSRDKLTLIQSRLEKVKSSYAAFDDAMQSSQKRYAFEPYKVLQNEYKLFKELSSSYVRILKDMDIRYYIQIGRTSWDERSDAFTDVDYLFEEKEVSRFHYFLFHKVVELQGVKQILNPYQNMPRSHNKAEFWVNEATVRYFQQYIEIKDDIAYTSVWQEVSADMFWKHQKHLGMEIYVKPYGYLASEASTEARPVGMTYVGNGYYGS